MEGIMKIEAAQPVFVPPYTNLKLDFLGVTHKLTSHQTGGAYYLFMTLPAGLDQWFDALEAAGQAGTLDDARYRKLSLEYGIEWLE
jgi:hypothetical protein